MAAYDTREAVAKLAKSDPEFEEFVKDPRNQRRISSKFSELVKYSRLHPQPDPPTTEYEYMLTIPMRDGYQSKISINKPPSTPALNSDGTPLVVLIHGGGFCIGHYTDVALIARSLPALYGVTVVSLSYRLAPEFKFPTASKDVWDGIMWCVAPENAKSLGVNLSAGFIIGGVSAGANLSAVTVQKYFDAKLASAPVTGVWLSIPAVLEEEIVPKKYKHLWFSRQQNADALILNQTCIDYVREAYQQDILSIDYSPFNSPTAHKGLPPIYFQVCGQDPLRDDGLVYEKVLRDNSVSTKIDVYPGVPHAHSDVFPTQQTSIKSKVDTVKGLGWLLGKQEDDDTIVKVVTEVGEQILREQPAQPSL